MTSENRLGERTPPPRYVRRRIEFNADPRFKAGGAEIVERILPSSQGNGTIFPAWRNFLTEAARDLPAVVSRIIQSPFGTNDTIGDRELNILTWGASLPAKAKELEPVWTVLESKLEDDINALVSNPEPILRAFLLADTLTYKSSLPNSERLNFVTRLMRKEPVKGWFAQQIDLVSEAEVGDGLAYETLRDKIRRFKDQLESYPTPVTQSEVYQNLRLLDGFWRAVEGRAMDFWEESGDEDTGKWMHGIVGKIEKNVLNSRFLGQIFRECNLDGIRADILAFMWAHIWTQPEQAEQWHPDERLAYFFSKEEVRGKFWQYFFSERSVIDQSKWVLPEGITATKLPEGIEALAYVHGQSEEIFTGFISTIPLETYNPRERLRVFRQLTGSLAFLQSYFPDSQNPLFLKTLLERVGDRDDVSHRFQDELGVLGNQKEGVLYLNMAGEGYARVPKPNQSRKAFLLTLQKEGTPIAYISQAEWFKPDDGSSLTPKGTSKEAPTIPVRLGQKQMLAMFGEISTPNPEDIAPLLVWLNDRIGPQNIDRLFEKLATYANNVDEKQTTPPVFLSRLLPQQQHLSILKAIGVIGIQQDESLVRIIIDCQEAGICAEADRLVIEGQLIDKELKIAGESAELVYSPLQLLLNCAVLFARQELEQKVLTKSEVTSVRQLVKEWNHDAKKRGLGLLNASLDQDTKGVDSALTILGQKAVLVPLL